MASLAYIGTSILEMRFEEFFDRPVMGEFLEIVVTLMSLDMSE